MIRVVTVQAIHADEPDALFHRAMEFAELHSAMAGLATYKRLPGVGRVIEGADYDLDVTLWGWLRTPHHFIHVDRMDPTARRCQSRERNQMVGRWDHEIAIDPHPDGAIWRDQVTLEAGWRTPFVALMCRHTYAYRHRNRQALQVTTRIEKG